MLVEIRYKRVLQYLGSARSHAVDGVDEGVVAAVAHGEPVRGEEHEVDVAKSAASKRNTSRPILNRGASFLAHTPVEIRKDVGDGVVEVPGEPADAKEDDHHEEHLDRLKYVWIKRLNYSGILMRKRKEGV